MQGLLKTVLLNTVQVFNNTPLSRNLLCILVYYTFKVSLVQFLENISAKNFCGKLLTSVEHQFRKFWSNYLKASECIKIWETF